ncbi:MAG: ABC transporter ATP-binding protein [Candidatus Heimdallarchaeota archaeon]|nr:ABC transporter ATP-binding protein [Candidatus Heimdallarchaeota archaeon]
MAHRRGPGRMFGEKSHRNRPAIPLIKMLWNYLAHYRIFLAVSALLIFIYTIGSMVSPIIISEGLDAAVIPTSPNTNFLLLLFIIFLILSLLIWLLNALNTYILAKVTADMLHDVRVDIFKRLVKADITFHKAEQSGNVTSRVTSDTNELATGISVVTTASSQILLTLGTFFILLATDVIITGVALLAIPIAGILANFLGKLGRKIMYRLRRAYGDVSGQMAESLAGVVIAKSFNREEWSSNILYDLNMKTYQFMKQMGALFNFMFPAVSMISTILVGMALLVGGWLPASAISIGSIYLGTILVQRFLGPIMHLTMYYPQIQSSLAAMDRVADVLEQKPQVFNSENATPLSLDDTSVTFEDLTFEYIKETPVLDHVSFKVAAGEKIAIVGHTGAGKTTLAALIARFYDPTSGRILIGNQDLRKVTLESLHATVGLIPQEPYLFADTVIENIRYGNPEITNGEIFELCKLIGAEDFIEALPDGYNTKLLESGKGLSSGQRQMITIARTMLADPKILVLDEATSRLDAYSESLVQLAQKALFKGRTTFVIAHRLTTIRDVDRIAVFKKGKLVELGTHSELLAKKGDYAELYYTYYQHQGIEELTEVHLAPKKKEVTEIRQLSLGMEIGHAMSGMHAGMNPKEMSPEQREKVHQLIQNLSPEERKEFMQKMQSSGE